MGLMVASSVLISFGCLIMLWWFALRPVRVWHFVGEVPTRWTLLGGALVIASVALRSVIEWRGQDRI